jgi:choice-of-anchor A domain-containing protein
VILSADVARLKSVVSRVFAFRAFALVSTFVSTCSFVALSLLPTAAAAQQIDLGVAADYSGFFFGNVSKLPDIEGRLAVGGNLSITAFSIGGRVPPGSGQPSLVVGGDLTAIGGGGIYDGYGNEGYAVYSGSRAPTVPTYIDFRKQTPNVIDFDAERTYLTVFSQQLRDMPATGTVTKLFSGITLTGTNADIEVFNLTADQVKGGLDLLLDNVKPSAHLVINVAADSQLKVKIGITMASLQDRHTKVLFNLHDADVVNFTGVLVLGSVLAPYACVRDSSGHLEGTIVAASWDSSMEIGYGPLTVSE